jgi:hypothetical protein
VSETTHGGGCAGWVVLRKSEGCAGATVGSMLESHVDDARRTLIAGLPVTERRLGSTALLEGGDGPPVVLLHGPGASAAHWLRVVPQLARGHHVVAPDLPDDGDAVDWLADLIDRTCPTPRSSSAMPSAVRSPPAARWRTRTGSAGSCWSTRSA